MKKKERWLSSQMPIRCRMRRTYTTCCIFCNSFPMNAQRPIYNGCKSPSTQKTSFSSHCVVLFFSLCLSSLSSSPYFSVCPSFLKCKALLLIFKAAIWPQQGAEASTILLWWLNGQIIQMKGNYPNPTLQYLCGFFSPLNAHAPPSQAIHHTYHLIPPVLFSFLLMSSPPSSSQPFIHSSLTLLLPPISLPKQICSSFFHFLFLLFIFHSCFLFSLFTFLSLFLKGAIIWTGHTGPLRNRTLINILFLFWG